MSDPRCWKNPLIPADTRVQIADGEIERLRVCLSKANEQAEHFEREWYLRGDELEQLRADFAASREREARMREAGQRLLDAIEHDTQIHRFSILWDGLRAALAEGARG